MERPDEEAEEDGEGGVAGEDEDAHDDDEEVGLFERDHRRIDQAEQSSSISRPEVKAQARTHLMPQFVKALET